MKNFQNTLDNNFWDNFAVNYFGDDLSGSCQAIYLLYTDRKNGTDFL